MRSADQVQRWSRTAGQDSSDVPSWLAIIAVMVAVIAMLAFLAARAPHMARASGGISVLEQQTPEDAQAR